MEFLESKRFNFALEVVQYANENYIRVVAITQEDGLFTLFYKKRLD